jgi:hypothetical protein
MSRSMLRFAGGSGSNTAEVIQRIIIMPFRQRFTLRST